MDVYGFYCTVQLWASRGKPSLEISLALPIAISGGFFLFLLDIKISSLLLQLDFKVCSCTSHCHPFSVPSHLGT